MKIVNYIVRIGKDDTVITGSGKDIRKANADIQRQKKELFKSGVKNAEFIRVL